MTTSILYFFSTSPRRAKESSLSKVAEDAFSRRFTAHNSGKVKSTQSRLPVVLVTQIVFHDKYKAYAFEKYLKTGSDRGFFNK